MNTADLDENMMLAHRDRAARANDELLAAQKAPAFFKPEFVERAKAEMQAAAAGATLWSL